MAFIKEKVTKMPNEFAYGKNRADLKGCICINWQNYSNWAYIMSNPNTNSHHEGQKKVGDIKNMKKEMKVAVYRAKRLIGA